jgi:hypothetical protein
VAGSQPGVRSTGRGATLKGEQKALLRVGVEDVSRRSDDGTDLTTLDPALEVARLELARRHLAEGQTQLERQPRLVARL